MAYSRNICVSRLSCISAVHGLSVRNETSSRYDSIRNSFRVSCSTKNAQLSSSLRSLPPGWKEKLARKRLLKFIGTAEGKCTYFFFQVSSSQVLQSQLSGESNLKYF